ncbi:MAG: small-conductance mechanosensitive channel [Flavobacteriales bacterium]|jgi:small-conductance mechanosensitive channel
MKEQMQTVLFTLMGRVVELGQVVGAALILVVSVSLYWFLSRKVLPRYFARERFKIKQERSIHYAFSYFFLFITLIAMLWSMGLDFTLFESDSIQIQLLTILKALCIFQFARLADWVISKILVYNYEKNRSKDTLSSKSVGLPHASRKELGNRSVQYIVYLFAVIFAIQAFDIDYTLFKFDFTPITISSVLVAILIILLAKLLAWILTQLLMYNYYRRREVNVGSRFAVNQLLKYIVYVIAVFIAIESLGVRTTVIWGGLAALLVGVGLGLQQTFNDLLSGILLLFERTVEVGHVVQVGDMIGRVKRIGLRTSIIETTENITVIVPNSKLVTDSVINWSHQDDRARFTLSIGVAYGSDTALVKKILLQVATDNIYVLGKPLPIVRFVGFGDSSLDFQLLVWSRNFIVIEDIKSDLRFEIDRLFRENDVVIPFPQRDVWMKK